jgi:hypothetical protein
MPLTFNPISGNFDLVNQPSLKRFATVVAAQASNAAGSEIPVCYIEEKEAFYDYCASCGFPADGDLVLTTADGGNTRWTLVQKVSRTQGDTGWINLGGAILTINSPTVLRLALSSAGGISIKSVRTGLPIGNYDVTISGVAGVKFVYFDDATGVLKFSSTLFDFGTQCPVAIAYWSGTAIVGAQTEYHGIRDAVWHEWAHNYFGSQYKSGLVFTGNVQPDNTTDPNLDTVQYLWSTPGIIQDEDAVINVGTGNWLQTLGSGLTSADAAIIPFYYWNGTNITTAAAMADRTPFIHGGAGTTPQWENAGVLTAAGNGTYVVYHYFASPQIGGQAIFARPHNAIFTAPGQFALAQAARPSQLNWSNYAEIKHLYSAVFRVNTGWGASPAHLCKLVSLQDFRLTAGSPTAAVSPTAHSGLTGLTGPDVHPDTSITNTSTGGALDSAVETNVGLATARLANFDYMPAWATGLAYRIGNRVLQVGVEFRAVTAHTAAAAFATDWTAGRWYALTPATTPTYTITTASGNALPTQLGRDLTVPVVGTGSAPVIAHVTPVGTVAPNDGQVYRFLGTSDSATVTFVNNDAAKGFLLNGDCELGKGRCLAVQYNAGIDRYFELSRSDIGGL